MLKKSAALLAALAMVAGLTACNTVQGAGKDVEKAGEGIQNAAEKAKQ
ncbi:MAG: entericidin A/B family lipoprotein [Comamonadaceae bacterium]|nr:entericidin A/B family lipoprotein [Comamonadaceae bacterium]RRD58828.1 entericidin A/B family lipoprotein [Comamonadaceae bacterium OH2545_COT-014]